VSATRWQFPNESQHGRFQHRRIVSIVVDERGVLYQMFSLHLFLNLKFILIIQIFITNYLILIHLETVDVPMKFGGRFGTIRRAIDLNFIVVVCCCR
jgi:hypothetical protein